MEDDYRATERVQRRHPKHLAYQLESARAELEISETTQTQHIRAKQNREQGLSLAILSLKALDISSQSEISKMQL